MNIQLTKELLLTTNSVHGFELIQTINRLVVDNKKKTETFKDVSETWYYPRLDQVLNKAISLDAELATDLNDLVNRLDILKLSIENVGKVFAKKGKVLQL